MSRRGAPRQAGRERGGTVLLTVLVVVTLGSLAASTVLVDTQAETAAADVARDRERARALARSGLRAVMAELSAQREALLLGGAPELTASWTLHTDELGRRGVVRLVDLVPDEPDLVALAEPSRLDINAAGPGVLARLPGIDRPLAERIVSARPFASVGELGRVDGIGPALLYGTRESMASEDGGGRRAGERTVGGARARPDGAERAGSVPAGASAGGVGGRPLTELLTVFSFEPNVQMGLVEASARGDLRINLGDGWSEGLGRAVSERFNGEAAAFLRRSMRAGVGFESDSDIVAQLARLQGDEYDRWMMALDTFSTTGDPYRRGRVDLNRAPADVLGSVPGISEAAGREIVDLRGGLSAEVRRRVTWPLEHGVLDAGGFERAIGHLATRSLQWRVRLRVGLVTPEVGDRASASLPHDVPLAHEMVVDAVIDVSSRRPRVAHLRNVTLFDTAWGFARIGADRPGREGASSGSGGIGDRRGDATPVRIRGDGRGAVVRGGASPGAGSIRPGLVLGGGAVEPGRGDGWEAPVDRRFGRWTTREPRP